MRYLVLTILLLAGLATAQQATADTADIDTTTATADVATATAAEEPVTATGPADDDAPLFGPKYTRANDGDLSSIGFSPTRYVLSILALAGLMGGLAWVLKSLRQRLPTVAGNEMSVQRRLALDKGNALVLVSVRGEEMLLGVGSNGVRLLRRYADSDDFAEPPTDADDAAGAFALPPLSPASQETR